MTVGKAEAISLTSIAILGLGCKPVGPGKREKVEEVLEALYVHAYAQGRLDERTGVPPS